MEQLSPERQQFLRTLDDIRHLTLRAYRILLGLIIVAILGVAGAVIVWRPWGAGHQGEWFYFSVAVLLALGWAVGQLLSVGRRRNRRMLPWTVSFSDSDGGQSWRSSAGEGSATRGLKFQFERQFQLPLLSVSFPLDGAAGASDGQPPAGRDPEAPVAGP